MGQHGAKWPEWRMQPAEPQPHVSAGDVQRSLAVHLTRFL